MDRKREFPPRKKGENVFEEVVTAEAIGLYPSNQMDDGMVPRSKAESRAGTDGEGESHTEKK